MEKKIVKNSTILGSGSLDELDHSTHILHI